MKRLVWAYVAVLLSPCAASAQDEELRRIQDVLPAAAAEQVAALLESVSAAGLPSAPVVSLVLEGVAKGHAPDAILAAVGTLTTDLRRAGAAFASAERVPRPQEIEAATSALRMGVDAAAVAELARSGPSGRSLAVPLLVLANLTRGGLPSEDALAAVQDGLAAQLGDAELVRDLGRGRGGPGVIPGRGGLGSGAGSPAQAGGGNVPLGPPEGAGRPSDAGRGGGRGRSPGPS